MKKKKKKLRGFTLIELIVVIAIIGVLAAVLVPNLLNNVKKSRQSAANANAKEIYDTLNLSVIDLEESGIAMVDFTLSESGQAGDVGDCVDLNIWLAGSAFTPEQRAAMNLTVGGYIDMIYKNGVPIAVAWSKTEDSNAIVGVYPDLPSLDDNVTWANWDANV